MIVYNQMCGRFAFAPKIKYDKHYGLVNHSNTDNFFSHNVSPGSFIPVVIRTNESEIKLMLWGWWEGKVVNARIETIERKPWFLNSIKNHRCIIPVSSFYEWREENSLKIPYRFRNSSQDFFSLAGIYRKNHETQIYECLIITTEANTSVKSIHHRMPVMLPNSWENYWLSHHLDIPFSQLIVANEPIKLKRERMDSKINSPRFMKEPEVINEN